MEVWAGSAKNKSEMNKHDLLQKIKSLENLSQDERAYLINLVNTKKKYGLVWENKPEDVEELLRENLPVLREVKEKRISGTPLPVTEAAKNNPELFEKGAKETEEYPNHILIEGDNLHALTALTFTHEGKVDVIYIDPPYNTGNKDFKYNDTYVDKEDSYRHSKWLSFMDKRLRIAKRLLSNNGVIFISIDDNEQAQLKLLCDEIYTELCFVGDVIWRSSDNSNNDAKQFSSDHNYTLVYSKMAGWLTNKLQHTDEQKSHYKNPDNDPRGPWFDGNPISSPNLRENLKYEILTPKGTKIKPPKNGWRWSKETLEEKMSQGEIYFNETFTNIKRRTYLIDQDGLPPSSLWIDLDVTGHNRQAKYELLKIFPEKGKNDLFATPKPVKLVKKILEVCSKSNSLVLDFFAGSGTTLHAVMQLNTDDGGKRQCILITNNENNICEEITYERNKRVINGYNSAKGEHVAGITNNNLRYYKSEFVSRDTSIKNKKELTRLATELLCIKEDMYEEQKNIGEYQLNATYVRGFHQGNHYMLIIYDDEVIEQVVKVIQHTVKKSKGVKLHFKIYVFSNGQYPYTEEFEEVLPHVTLCALPDAIYKAYQNVLPKKHRAAIPQIEEEAITEE